MDYTSDSNIRFGEIGNAVYKKCGELFSELYQYAKNEKDVRKRYDYFLSIYKI
jgi:hypothetical protein